MGVGIIRLVSRRVRVLGLAILLACATGPVALHAQEEDLPQLMRIDTASDNGFGRIVLSFPRRTNLPPFSLSTDNGVLIVEFDAPLQTNLLDLSEQLPGYVAAARIDPDGRGIRIGMKRDFKINKTEAGERLYLDLLPRDWTGVEPGLPREVVEELSRRARMAAIEAERERRLEYVRENKPTATLRVGEHPTFMRLVFDWSIPAEGVMRQEGTVWTVSFDWPVSIDMGELKARLPEQIVEVSEVVDESGSRLYFDLQDGIEPRFYRLSENQFALDIDLDGPADSVDLADLLPEGEPLEETAGQVATLPAAEQAVLNVDVPDTPAAKVTPYVEHVGQSVHIVFPFQRDTPAAVFRRGNTLWMIFDTAASVGAPESNSGLENIFSDFTVQPAGNTTVVRMKLVENRLATLGSEGRSWLLSIGDQVLVPAELINLSRRQNADGLFEVVADIDRPSRVHELRDPEVGDILEVVTAYPPARGTVREFDFVDFTALRSIHGLVVQPAHEDVVTEIESKNAVIRSNQGLIVSAPQLVRTSEDESLAAVRDGYIDLGALAATGPAAYVEGRERLMQMIAEASANDLNDLRLQLGKYFLANRFFHEASGMAALIRGERQPRDVKPEIQLLEAAAQTMARRWENANEILELESLAGLPDALIWRTIARAGAGDYANARRDALVAELSLEGYPHWVKNRFLLAATRSAIEENDIALANRFAGLVQTAALDRENLSNYEILAARLDEAAGRFDEALDTLGQVISADIRPTRAEAVYRTMLLLDKMGRLDLVRAADTLASEVLVWRGGPLEAKMLKLLAEIYFRNGNFRPAFETVKSLATANPEAKETADLLEEAQAEFADLYLNGQADALEPVDALTLYYDFRSLTPTGARGDEMVRNLARRLIKFDLLEQAAQLLQYQVDQRLDGAARAQIAADLAIVYLAQRRPEKAVQVLNQTRLAGISPNLERQRRILEARAMIDAGREDLALDLLASLDGRDAALLRVDAQWAARRYQDAAQTLELMYAAAPRQDNWNEAERQGILKMAVGYVLAGDTIGVKRLRTRFSDDMAATPQWPLFDFVTGQIQVTSVEFRKIAEQVASKDSLDAFLKTYRTMYAGEGALSPSRPVLAQQTGADA